MLSDLNDWIQAIHDTPLATAIREGDSYFPWIETFHVISLVTVLGTIAIVDLRLLGLASRKRNAGTMIRELTPITWLAFLAAFLTGSLLFASNAIRYSENSFIKAKCILLLLAGVNMLVFHFGSYRSISEWGDQTTPPVAARISGGLSLLLWLIIICVGRWIGFTLE